MADEVVRYVAYVICDEHGVGQLVERFGVDRGDRLDEVVETDRRFSASRLARR